MTLKEVVISKLAEGEILVKKNSPEILLGLGILGGIAAVALVAAKSEEVAEKTKKYKETKALVVEMVENDILNAKEAKMANLKDGAYFAADVAESYLIPILVGGLSIASLVWSHNILKQRNLALSAAYTAVAAAYKAYRDRVREELGDEADVYFSSQHKRKGGLNLVDDKGKAIDFYDDEGKDLAGEIFDPDAFMLTSPYVGVFDESSVMFGVNHSVNKAYLTMTQNYFNTRLDAVGTVFLNEVFERIGIPTTPVGCVAGWSKYSETGDGHISLGIEHPINEEYFSGANRGRLGNQVYIVPNCDGDVHNLL